MRQPPASQPKPVPITTPANARQDVLLFGACGLVAVLAVCYFVIHLLGAQEKPVMEPRNVAAASSTILAAPTTVPEAPKQIQTMLAQLEKVEAAKQGKPGGPLYDPGSSNVALMFETLPLDSPQVVEAQAVLAKYLQTASWRERLPFVFEPERIEALMQEKYDKQGKKDPEHGSLSVAGIITAGSSKVLNLQFPSAQRPDSGMRANFHRTRAGKLLLDWESWVTWSEKTWPEFKQERSQLPVLMRVVASESNYYNYEFSESWRWLAVKLRSPDGMHNVTGYVERNSIFGVALANMIGVPLPHQLPDGTPMPALNLPGAKALVTVRLAFPNKAQSDHCVKITELLADRWLLFPGEAK